MLWRCCWCCSVVVVGVVLMWFFCWCCVLLTFLNPHNACVGVLVVSAVGHKVL